MVRVLVNWWILYDAIQYYRMQYNRLYDFFAGKNAVSFVSAF